MAENRNLALQLLITAKDEASSIFGKVFGALIDPILVRRKPRPSGRG